MQWYCKLPNGSVQRITIETIISISSIKRDGFSAAEGHTCVSACFILYHEIIQ